MAETRAITSAEDIYQVLCDSHLFASVTKSGSGNTVTCLDAAGNAVLHTSGVKEITFSIDADHAYPSASLGSINYAYLCSSGVILTKYYDGLLYLIFVLTRSNTGEPVLILIDHRNNNWNAFAWGDVPTTENKAVQPVQANQYALMPYITNAVLGINSYTPDAFYAVVYTGTNRARSFTMHGDRWFAVGKAVLRDNPAP